MLPLLLLPPLLSPSLAGPPAPPIEPLEAGILVDGGCSACVASVADLGGSVHASSTLASEDGRFAVAHLLDDDPTTAWCEGAEGPGVGEWVELRLPRPVALAELHVLAGYTKTLDTLRQNGRVQRLRIELDGRPAGELRPRDIARPRDPSVDDATWLADLHRFGAIAWADHMGLQAAPSASRIRFVIAAVYPGVRYADTCLSTLRPRFPPLDP